MTSPEASLTSGVTIAVLTYRRPVDLAALLPMLLAQVGEVSSPARILVVDNDPAASARGYVGSLGSPLIRYVNEPKPGIAVARNRALDECADVELMIFIDDDERPVDGWLQSLLDTHRKTGADGVVGPVASRFTGELDPWIAGGGFFTRRRLATGTEVTVAATNNLLLDMASVRRRSLRFDEKLGLIGGEDTLFTKQLTRGDGRIVWCAEAMVHDIVPADRMTRRWVTKRAFRMGGSASRVDVLVAGSFAARTLTRVKQLALGSSRVGAGLVRLALGVVTFDQGRRAAGVRNCARGLGLITGVFGFEYREYSRS
jgi:hypothetical protein